jgi:hypothetical protein
MFLPQASLVLPILFTRAKHYDWRPHEDNYRAYTKPSIIWQFNDEYEKGVFSSIKKFITPERNRFMEEVIEASECLKTWWERGLIQRYIMLRATSRERRRSN